MVEHHFLSNLSHNYGFRAEEEHAWDRDQLPEDLRGISAGAVEYARGIGHGYSGDNEIWQSVGRYIFSDIFEGVADEGLSDRLNNIVERGITEVKGLEEDSFRARGALSPAQRERIARLFDDMKRELRLEE